MRPAACTVRGDGASLLIERCVRDVHIRVLTAAPRIKPTSTRCHSAWQPKPGRGSTYRRGDFVQTSGTSSALFQRGARAPAEFDEPADVDQFARPAPRPNKSFKTPP